LYWLLHLSLPFPPGLTGIKITANLRGKYKLEQKDWGIGAPSSKATRTIEVQMTDNMRFAPKSN